jgi:hypothetical protein
MRKRKRAKKYKYLVDPEGRFKLTWDTLHIFFMGYIVIATPYKFSFVGDDESLIWNIADYVVDCFFLLDMILTFFIPVYTKNKQITNHCKIAIEYFKLWFWIDFLSIFPFDWIFSQTGGYTILLKATKIPRLWKVFRVAKLFRVFRLKGGRKNKTFI